MSRVNAPGGSQGAELKPFSNAWIWSIIRRRRTYQAALQLKARQGHLHRRRPWGPPRFFFPPPRPSHRKLGPAGSCRWRKSKDILPWQSGESEVPFWIPPGGVLRPNFHPQMRIFRSGRAAPDFLSKIKIDGPKSGNLLKDLRAGGAQEKACRWTRRHLVIC